MNLESVNTFLFLPSVAILKAPFSAFHYDLSPQLSCRRQMTDSAYWGPQRSVFHTKISRNNFGELARKIDNFGCQDTRNQLNPNEWLNNPTAVDGLALFQWLFLPFHFDWHSYLQPLCGKTEGCYIYRRLSLGKFPVTCVHWNLPFLLFPRLIWAVWVLSGLIWISAICLTGSLGSSSSGDHLNL